MRLILRSLFSFAPTISPPQYSSHFCKYISSNINTISSEINPCNFKDWDISQHQAAPQWIFSAETKMEMETLSLIIGMFGKNYNVEEVNIE